MKTELDGGAVIYRIVAGQPEYLLLQSATSDFWGFTKGHLEGQEDYAAAAIREAHEETGLTIQLDQRFTRDLEYDMANGHHKVVRFFSAQVAPSVDLTLQAAEISAAGWFNYQAAKDRLTYDNLRELLADFEAYLTK